MTNKDLIHLLHAQHHLEESQWVQLFATWTKEDLDYAMDLAREITVARFGKKIYFRGIVEFSNICKNDCYYCGIRCGNKNVSRYRLTKEDILCCCEEGYETGFRTFVLQGGEDGWFTDDRMCDIIRAIKEKYPDCAVTLSLGERSRESYQKLYDAGADRYLLRHETADDCHYRILHPASLSLANRMRCLTDLKEISYQTGCGIMVGSPGQTPETLAKDMVFMQEFKPEMVGIGPFLPHHATPLGSEPKGDLNLTLTAVAIARLMLPAALIPSTTALATLSPTGRLEGILSGANVVMPNLSPSDVRAKYAIYENKASWGKEAAEGLKALEKELESIGYHIDYARGDFNNQTTKQ